MQYAADRRFGRGGGDLAQAGIGWVGRVFKNYASITQPGRKERGTEHLPGCRIDSIPASRMTFYYPLRRSRMGGELERPVKLISGPSGGGK